ncbi:uncharacterized protein [Argopecten irradians]|uniref:uncharacterized protein isoform X2 n=1 Tax=Argopecten irradians TaxID=31199 RepID=UPI003713A974
MAEVTHLDDQQRKKQLLQAIKNKRRQDALQLIQKGVEIDYKDETDSSPLHYAAVHGFDDVIEELLRKGADTEASDKDGRTAVHIAAIYGHVRSIVILVAFGAKIDTGYKNKRQTLDHAVDNKHVAVVDLLCQFGAEPELFDWTWLTDPGIQKREKDLAMGKLIQKQCRLYPGFRNGDIKFDIKRINGNEGHLKNTGVDVIVPNGQGDFYLYMCRIPVEYSNRQVTDQDGALFGDCLECQTWGSTVKHITLRVTIQTSLHKNEEVVLRSPSNGGLVDGVKPGSSENGEQTTIVEVTVPLEPTGISDIIMAKREITECLEMSTEAIKIEPKCEPEAEIDIPADTFGSCKLLIKFVDTTSIIEDSEQDKEGKSEDSKSILRSNILELSTNDGQQPTKEIDVKLPITSKDQSEEIIVLMTSNPDRKLAEWKWEVIPAKIDNGKAVFKVGHFSTMIPTSKSIYEKDPESTTKKVRSVMERERKVVFMATVKKTNDTEAPAHVTIACGTRRKIEELKREVQRSSHIFKFKSDQSMLFPFGQRFGIAVDGNLRKVNENEINELVHVERRNSLCSFEIVTPSGNPSELNGNVCISSIDKYEEVIVKTRFLFIKTATKELKDKHKKVGEIPIKVTLTIPEPVRVPEAGPLHNDPIPVVDPVGPMGPPEQIKKWEKLLGAVKKLTNQEAQLMGTQLRLEKELMDTVLKDTKRASDIPINVFTVRIS